MEINKIIVHGGVFHADDAMCVAIAKQINPDVEVQRVFKVPDEIEPGTIVADIGRGKYDHHQPDAEVREDGGKRAACGLLLADVWKQVFPDEASYKRFESAYIIPIEITDNGGEPNPLSLSVSDMVPNWDSKESMDEAFLKAVDRMSEVVELSVERSKSIIRAQDLAQDAVDHAENKVAVLKQYHPWQSVICPSDVEFVVFPSNRGGYNLQTVPTVENGRTPKVEIPESWLQTKPEGCTFCHPGRFLASFDTQEHAVASATEIVKNHEMDKFVQNVMDDISAFSSTPKESSLDNILKEASESHGEKENSVPVKDSENMER